jgi:hypothetical protein
MEYMYLPDKERRKGFITVILAKAAVHRVCRHIPGIAELVQSKFAVHLRT